jgi:hypothetical protein
VLIFKNLHACGGYQVPPSSVEIECFAYFFINPFNDCSATNIVLSKEI